MQLPLLYERYMGAEQLIKMCVIFNILSKLEAVVSRRDFSKNLGQKERGRTLVTFNQ